MEGNEVEAHILSVKFVNLQNSALPVIDLVELQFSQLLEAAFNHSLIFIDRKLLPGIAQLFEGLRQPKRAVFACARGVIEIEHLGHERLIRAYLLKDAPVGINNGRTSAAPLPDAIDADKIALIEQRICARHHQFKLAVRSWC